MVPIGLAPEGHVPGTCVECAGPSLYYCIQCGLEMCRLCDTTIIHLAKKFASHQRVARERKDEALRKGGRLAKKKRKRRKKKIVKVLSKKNRFCTQCKIPVDPEDPKHASHPTVALSNLGNFMAGPAFALAAQLCICVHSCCRVL